MKEMKGHGKEAQNFLLLCFYLSPYQDQNHHSRPSPSKHGKAKVMEAVQRRVNRAGMRLRSLERPVRPWLASEDLTGKQFPH